MMSMIFFLDQKRPADSLNRIQLKRTASRTMAVIKKFVKVHKYRRDLKMVIFLYKHHLLKNFLFHLASGLNLTSLFMLLISKVEF